MRRGSDTWRPPGSSAGRKPRPDRWRHGFLAALGASIGAAIVITLADGTPKELPGVALGSPVLLHVERAVALVGAFLAVGVVSVRAARGELPTEITTSGVRFEVGETADRWARVLGDLKERIDHQDAAQREIAEALAELADRIHELGEKTGR